MPALLIFVGVVVYVAAAVLFRGWVISVMWTWFVVPFGLPSIGVVWAIGLSCMVGMFITSPASAKSSDDEVISKMLMPFVTGFIALLIGWIVHLNM